MTALEKLELKDVDMPCVVRVFVKVISGGYRTPRR